MTMVMVKVKRVVKRMEEEKRMMKEQEKNVKIVEVSCLLSMRSLPEYSSREKSVQLCESRDCWIDLVVWLNPNLWFAQDRKD